MFDERAFREFSRGNHIEVLASAIHGTRMHVVSNQGPVMKNLTDLCRGRVMYYYNTYHNGQQIMP